MKYTYKIGNQEIIFNMRKEDAKRVAQDIGSMINVRKYFREINGVIGGESQESVLYVPFGGSGAGMTDESGYETAKAEFFASLPAEIGISESAEIVTRARAILYKYMPVKDDRLTQEQVTERKQKVSAMAEAQQARVDTWRAEWCASNTPIEIPSDKMGITLEVTFDDSDSMTDYYNPHASIGETMLLALVKSRNQSERICRSGLELYPELAGLSWTWHTENYSMGHGNYLISEWVGKINRKAYDGRGEVTYRYEIRCRKYVPTSSINNRSGHWNRLLPYKNYPGKATAKKESVFAPRDATSGDNVTVTFDRDWTWVKYPVKPTASILAACKEFGGRFSNKRIAWYFTRHLTEEEITRVTG